MIKIIVIDGYVFLDSANRPGLGAHIHGALGGSIPIIGVAESAFRGSAHALRVYRGGGTRPLCIASLGRL
jgi:deoxyribonuclease V